MLKLCVFEYLASIISAEFNYVDVYCQWVDIEIIYNNLLKQIYTSDKENDE